MFGRECSWEQVEQATVHAIECNSAAEVVALAKRIKSKRGNSRATIPAQEPVKPEPESTPQKISVQIERRGNEIGALLTPILVKKEDAQFQKLRAAAIISEVANQHNFTAADIKSSSREYPLVRARHEAMYRVVAETKFSLVRVGRIFDRDHTTILNGIRMHAKRNNLPSLRREAE